MKRYLLGILIGVFLLMGFAMVAAQTDEPTPTADVIISTTVLSTDVPIFTAIPTETAAPSNTPIVTAEPTQPPTGDEQPPIEPPSPFELAVGAVLTIILVVERWTVFWKPGLSSIATQLKFTDEAYNSLVVGFAVLSGIFAVFATSQTVNLFVELPFIPPLIGTLFTGGVIGFGSGFAHAVIDFLRGVTVANRAKAISAIAQSPISLKNVPSELK